MAILLAEDILAKIKFEKDFWSKRLAAADYFSDQQFIRGRITMLRELREWLLNYIKEVTTEE